MKKFYSLQNVDAPCSPVRDHLLCQVLLQLLLLRCPHSCILQLTRGHAPERSIICRLLKTASAYGARCWHLYGLTCDDGPILEPV